MNNILEWKSYLNRNFHFVICLKFEQISSAFVRGFIINEYQLSEDFYKTWEKEGKIIFKSFGSLYINIFPLIIFLYNNPNPVLLLSLNSTSVCRSPLTPDPIRVPSCVCCLFWTNSMAVTSIFLSISLSHLSCESLNRCYQ